MEDIEVPPFFICPISLQIMKDPVTLPTGITYDRESIERWLFSSNKNNTCPVTKQPIPLDCDLTPNHTLRRLIQSWCTLNASYGIERFPTPRPPVSKTEITKLLRDANKSLLQQMKCLRKLRSLAEENDTNKRCIEASGAVEFLVSIVTNFGSLSFQSREDNEGFEMTRPRDEALCLLHNLRVSEPKLKTLASYNNGEFIEALTLITQSGNFDSSAYAIYLLKSILEVADPMQLISIKPELFEGLVRVIRDQLSKTASKSALQVLINLCPWGRNRIKAVNAGAVWTLVDTLLESSLDRRSCEMELDVLDLLCQCADGRAELLKHGAGLAVVSKKILRVSHVATQRAIRIILSVAKHSATTASVLQEMLTIGVVAKLCLVLQVECGSKTKEKAREVLRLHARAWKNSPCIPSHLFSSYPA